MLAGRFMTFSFVPVTAFVAFIAAMAFIGDTFIAFVAFLAAMAFIGNTFAEYWPQPVLNADESDAEPFEQKWFLIFQG